MVDDHVLTLGAIQYQKNLVKIFPVEILKMLNLVLMGFLLLKG